MFTKIINWFFAEPDPIGKKGKVIEEITAEKTGAILVGDALYIAEAEQSIPAGKAVRVTGVRGYALSVRELAPRRNYRSERRKI